MDPDLNDSNSIISEEDSAFEGVSPMNKTKPHSKKGAQLTFEEEAKPHNMPPSDLNAETLKMQGIRPNHKMLSTNPRRGDIKLSKLGSHGDSIERNKHSYKNSNSFGGKRESNFLKRSTTQR